MSEFERLDRIDDAPFTWVSNHIVRNRNISRAAKGLLLELCSHSTEGFDLSHKGLLSAATDGKTRLQGAVDELKRHGYLSIDQVHVNGGHVEWRWRFTSDPDRAPLSPYPQNRDSAESSFSVIRKTGTHKNKQESLQDSKKKEQEIPRLSLVGDEPEQEEASREDFEALWRTHTRGPKKKAWDEYRKAVPKRVTHETMEGALKTYVETELNGKFKGHDLFRWIRDDRWEQELAKVRTNGSSGMVAAGGGAGRFL